METVKIFASELWPALVSTAVVLLAGCLGIYFASHSYPLWVKPRDFIELSGLSRNVQQRLLAETSREAFHRWQMYVPYIVFSIFLALGITFHRTLVKAGTVSDSLLLTICTSGLLGVIGWWIAAQLQLHYLRPLVKRSLKQSGNLG